VWRCFRLADTRQYRRVTDRRTDGRRTDHDDSIIKILHDKKRSNANIVVVEWYLFIAKNTWRSHKLSDLRMHWQRVSWPLTTTFTLFAEHRYRSKEGRRKQHVELKCAWTPWLQLFAPESVWQERGQDTLAMLTNWVAILSSLSSTNDYWVVINNVRDNVALFKLKNHYVEISKLYLALRCMLLDCHHISVTTHHKQQPHCNFTSILHISK